MMNKRGIAGMLKLGLILGAFAAAACVMLAFVYSGTANIIAARQQADLEAALAEVFPGADTFEQLSKIQIADPAVTVEASYAALKNNETVGAVLSLSRAAYGGTIKVLAGVSAQGFVTGVRIMEHSETPGLGANAASPKYFVDRARGITFYGQFAGKNARDSFEVPGDVAAITASTVTSKAVADAVKAAAVGVADWFANQR